MTLLNIHTEQYILYIACILYAISFTGIYFKHKFLSEKYIIFTGIFGLILHTVSIALRWERTGHGPFINLYEILSSNVWSLSIGFILFYVFFRTYRPVSQFIIPVIAVLMVWLLLTSPSDTYLPPTYNTVWLYFHVFTGKIFLALLLIATGLALYSLFGNMAHLNRKEPQAAIMNMTYRFLAFAFLFDSLMLLFGAVWAQDAWGRYWAWDPLETWAFMTWLAIVFVLHWRSENSNHKLFNLLVVSCFVLAFLTFFGVPFISTAPHKGMI